MPEKLTINWACDNSNHCLQSWRRWMEDAGREPFEIDKKTAFYTFQDFLVAYAQNEIKKAKASSPIIDEAEDELTRKTRLQADILEIEKAKLQLTVLDTEEVFRVLENRDIAIRRVITTSELPDPVKDKILNDLRSINIDDILAERSVASGTTTAGE